MDDVVKNIEVQLHAAPGFAPSYKSDGAAGADLKAHIDNEITLPPGKRVLIPTSVEMAIPFGYEGQVRPRSGLAIKHGITVMNAPGTIDSDYRGEVRVALVNLSQEEYTIRRGDRIAQLVICPVVRAGFVETEELSETDRGARGFGSTGT